MIIARGTKGKKEFLLLGLTAANISRLVQGEPILCTREKHGHGVPDNWEICLVFGETEQSLYRDFKTLGLVKPTTEVFKESKLGISDET